MGKGMVKADLNGIMGYFTMEIDKTIQ